MKKQMKVTGTTFSLLGFDELENKFTISTICGNLVIIPKVLPYQFLRFSFDGIIDSATATGAVNYIKELYGINDEDFTLDFAENPATHNFLCTKKAPTTF